MSEYINILAGPSANKCSMVCIKERGHKRYGNSLFKLREAPHNIFSLIPHCNDLN